MPIEDYSSIKSWRLSIFLPSRLQKETKIKERHEHSSELMVLRFFAKLSPNMQSFAKFLLPSFISNRYSKTPSRYILKSTSWLDGLRGVACLLVYSYHFHDACFPFMRHPWNPEFNNSFIELPIIRVVHSGPTMVAIFFVISGFVLSIKSVRAMKEYESSENSHIILRNLASSVLRRYLRLVLPCAGSFILVGIFLSAGWFEAVPYSGTDGTLFQSTMIGPRAPRQDHLYDQIVWILGDFYKYAVQIILLNNSVPYRWETNSHLWTIPVEFRQSLYVFLMTLALSNLKRWARVNLILPVCVILGFQTGSWNFALFMLGFLLAEIHAKRESDESYPDLGFAEKAQRSFYDRHSLLFLVLKVAAFIVSLFIGSYPIHAPTPEETTGFTYLTSWTPSSSVYRIGDGASIFWVALGGGMIVTSINFLPFIQRLLCSGVCQYLGRISFSLYLVHGPLLQSLGYSLVLATWRVVGVQKLSNPRPDSPTYEEVSSIGRRQNAATHFSFAITTVVTIWVADIFWRTFDAPSVKFTRWLEKQLSK